MTHRFLSATWLATFLAVTFGLGTVADEAADPGYQVISVKRKLLREEPEPKARLAEGDPAAAGDLLRTGWRGEAVIEAPAFGARFHLGSSTRARLAGERPGVLLEVEQGRLRALFDKLAGDPPPERLVETPSAVLAVRGTSYGVEVSSSGDTDVVVFSGEVEVMDRAGIGPSVQLRPGEACRVNRGQAAGAPQRHGMSPADWDGGRRSPTASGSDGRGESMPGRGPEEMGPAGSPGGTGSQRQQGGSRRPG